MPSKPLGPAFRVRKKNANPHNKNHRWESNTAKIAKLGSLDAIRKVRRHDLDAEDLSTTTSYFRNGLERWADTNIAKGFHAFKRGAFPLCDSLPQILHFQDELMKLFEEHISTCESDSLEPLLDLLTALARDLGLRFEKHYETALNLLAGVVSKPQDATVVGAAFAALSFLFKYLSKHVTPNLIPTYDVLARLLGKTKQSPHTVRLTAESMSFLVTKAAAPSYRDSSLRAIVEHVRLDLNSTVGSREFDLFSHGLMAMFAGAIKGTGTTLHSTSEWIVRALLRSLDDEEPTVLPQSPWSEVVRGVLVSAARHSDPESFRPVLDVVVESLQEQGSGNTTSIRQPLFLLNLLGTLAAFQNGAKVSDWSKVVRTASSALDTLASSTKVEDLMDLWDAIVSNIAIVWNFAPMDSLIPSVSGLVSVLTREPMMGWFVPFCGYFADLNPERFRSLFQKLFHR